MKGYLVTDKTILKLLFGSEKEAEEIKRFMKKFEGQIYSLEILKISFSNHLCDMFDDSETIELIYGKFLNLPIKYIALNESILKKARELSVNDGVNIIANSYKAAASLREFEIR